MSDNNNMRIDIIAGMDRGQGFVELENLELVSEPIDLNIYSGILKRETFNSGFGFERLLLLNKLEHLSLYGQVDDVDAFFSPIINGIQHNTSLKTFRIYAQCFGPNICQLIADIINIRGTNGIKFIITGLHQTINHNDIQLVVKALMKPENNTEIIIGDHSIFAMPNAINFYNQVIPAQIIKKILNSNRKDNYKKLLFGLMSTLKDLWPSIPDYIDVQILQYELEHVLKSVYQGVDSKKLVLLLGYDAQNIKNEILLTNTFKEQILRQKTIRTMFYFETLKEAYKIESTKETLNRSGLDIICRPKQR